ncbi:phage Gp37/Gp68 family protein [Rhizobium tropici]|uniref:Phage Gp37/Gp68 family protein n=1 Tax=Rhizobium tropici TaxID=398 RepID=A0A329YF73_RHITR|nr:phage Gp37/Gp68 family protein [Rhizobium tropici]
MADHTKIEWTDATWNIVTGCQIVSPGCTNCYAMRLAGTRLRNIPSRFGLTTDTKAGPVWTGDIRFNREWLDQPLRWKAPRMIFVAAHGDLFADGVTKEQLDQIFAVMALSSQHIFQVLTKRPERMRDYLLEMERCFKRDEREFSRRWGTAAAEVTNSPCAAGAIEDIEFPLLNVWFGISAEDQRRADERIPFLCDTPAAIRWISAEPLLGDIRFSGLSADRKYKWDWLTGETAVMHPDGPSFDCGPKIDWVVAGGESGPNARPMHPDWARSLRDQCATAGVPFLFKQWGNWQIASEGKGHLDHNMARNDAFWVDIDGTRHKPSSTGLTKPCAMHRVSKSVAGRLLDGVEHNAFPPLPPHFKEHDHDQKAT